MQTGKPGRGRIYNSVTETIGDTPLVRIHRMAKDAGVKADILLKLEFFNPLASVKDRIGVGMIEALEKQGAITPGKSTLIEPTSGSVRFAGTELTGLDARGMKAMRKRMQIIFQDPFSSLNPRMRVEGIIGEALIAHRIGRSQRERRDIVAALLEEVGLAPDQMRRFPHEFSGGQRQRIGIARALAVEPEFIVADESVSALDVSVQAQILDLLAGLQKDLGLSYLFITHNLAVVDYLAHEVAVMYLGRIVERGTTEEVIGAARHPYTRALLSAVPRIEKGADPTLARPVIRLRMKSRALRSVQ